MSDSRHERLEDVVLDDLFPEVDLALRRGRHIDRDDADWYTFVTDAQEHLERLYRRFGCELVHRAEGYFYLLPTSDKLGRRHLSAIDMLVGQALTLLYLDPLNVQNGGLVTREQVLAHLASVMGADALVFAMNPKRKKIDQRVAEETARNKVFEGVRRLSTLGFVEILDGSSLRLRPALMRFAEPVRDAAAPEAALEKLVASGEVVLTDGGEADNETGDDDGVEPESTEELPEEPAPIEEPIEHDGPEDEP